MIISHLQVLSGFIIHFNDPNKVDDWKSLIRRYVMTDYYLVPKCRLAVFRIIYTNKTSLYFDGISSMQGTLQGDTYKDILDTIPTYR